MTDPVAMLDAPPWSALTTAHRKFAQGGALARRYHSEIGPFGALAECSAVSFAALALLASSGPVALMTDDPLEPPAPFQIARQASITQMVLDRPVTSQGPDPIGTALATADIPDMLDLATRTRPGPFGPRTAELGLYLGIRNDRTLAAMAGERMRFGPFVEISAVCTDPAFRGRGLAAALLLQLARDIQARGQTPFLHVFDTNAAAIALYDRLGFRRRRGFVVTSLKVPE